MFSAKSLHETVAGMTVRLGVGRSRLLRVLIRKTSASPDQKIMCGSIFWLLRALIRKTFAYQKDFCEPWSERFSRALIKKITACLDQKDFCVSERLLRVLIRKTFACLDQKDFCVSLRKTCVPCSEEKIKKKKSACLDHKDFCVPCSQKQYLRALIRKTFACLDQIKKINNK